MGLAKVAILLLFWCMSLIFLGAFLQMVQSQPHFLIGLIGYMGTIITTAVWMASAK
ncbi:hypothetical protein [Alicyclobacillus sp. SO9]|uniref:hypothetical protein n=1 Tax=Alicyclobacillus sp. SO9 TaxID=2665646 RepID=UPI0018E89C47|nr:hypothetical protein [Alicyclobacillus sp. SO9]QQE80920.1 hypothetical protein GI364_11345 [Alicyclobacillus sp. SO9]